MIRLLGKTNELSYCLQRKDQNIVRTVSLVGVTLDKLQGIRENGWDELLKETNDFCIKHNIVVPNMDDTIPARGRSRGRGSTMVTYYHRFRYEIFNVVHDQIIVELNNRFAEKSTQLLRCIACLDPTNSFANFDEDKRVELAEMYADDLSIYEISFVLKNQLETFIADVRSDSDLGGYGAMSKHPQQCQEGWIPSLADLEAQPSAIRRLRSKKTEEAAPAKGHAARQGQSQSSATPTPRSRRCRM